MLPTVIAAHLEVASDVINPTTLELWAAVVGIATGFLAAFIFPN